MIAEERYAMIEKMLKEKKYVSTKDFASELKVTETTIRRDCEELEKQGVLLRVHGGAKIVNRSSIVTSFDEILMTNRFSVNTEAKERVAKKAAELVKDGDCIYLDGGSSVFPMINALKDKKIKIVTNSQLITKNFTSGDSELFCLGGKYLPEYCMCVGPMTLMGIEHFSFDHAFISCAGVDISSRLVYTAEMDTTAVKMKAMERASNKYLLVDSSKVDVKGFCGFMKTDEFEAVICNTDNNINYEELPDNFIFA